MYIHIYVYMTMVVGCCLSVVLGRAGFWGPRSLAPDFEGPNTQYVRLLIPISLPRPPNVPLLRASWSLLVGIWGLLKGSSGVMVLDFEAGNRKYRVLEPFGFVSAPCSSNIPPTDIGKHSGLDITALACRPRTAAAEVSGGWDMEKGSQLMCASF